MEQWMGNFTARIWTNTSGMTRAMNMTLQRNVLQDTLTFLSANQDTLVRERKNEY